MKSTIKKYLAGKSSDIEQKEILDWIRKDQNLTEFQVAKEEWKDEIIHEEVPAEFQQDWQEIRNGMFVQMQSAFQHTQRSLTFFRYAAIFILLFSVPTLIYFYSHSPKSSQLVFTKVQADFGQISKVVLPDSTVIWINSGSTISYNNQFSASNRSIELNGEAFFKVHKNKDLPFVVTSEDLQVKVLGTEFGVSAYPEEKNIEIVLEKGKVELSSVSSANIREEMYPGELVSFNKENKKMVRSTVNTGLYTSWKDGLINIYNLPLSELVLRLEKRYNQKFLVDEAIKNLPYTFTIKNEELSSILSLMEKITPVEAIQRGYVIELRHTISQNKFKEKNNNR